MLGKFGNQARAAARGVQYPVSFIFPIQMQRLFLQECLQVCID